MVILVGRSFLYIGITLCSRGVTEYIEQLHAGIVGSEEVSSFCAVTHDMGADGLFLHIFAIGLDGDVERAQRILARFHIGDVIHGKGDIRLSLCVELHGDDLGIGCLM